MNDVKLWAFTLLVSSMIAAIFENLTPSSQKKQMSYIVQLFLLLCLILPVNGLLKDRPKLDLSSVQNQTVEALNTDEILKTQFEADLKHMIFNKLETLGIFAQEIGIDFSVSENTVKVSEINVFLDAKDSQKQDEIKKELESFLGIAVKAAVN